MRPRSITTQIIQVNGRLQRLDGREGQDWCLMTLLRPPGIKRRIAGGVEQQPYMVLTLQWQELVRWLELLEQQARRALQKALVE